MVRLIKGQWLEDAGQYLEFNGCFQRGTTVFHNFSTVDDSAGPSSVAGFKIEKGRYRLSFYPSTCYVQILILRASYKLDKINLF